MTDPLPPPAEGLLHLDGLRFDDIFAWLERALRGQELLPMIVPDETPESPILRERRLSTQTREDLRQACLTLVRRFVREPRDEDGYVMALLRLATGFQLRETVTDLHSLTSDREAFAALDANQSWAVLSTMLDLRAPVSLDFWKEIATRGPGQHGVIAVAGLLTHGYHSALQLLPSLPDDETVADALFVVIDQHAGLLNSDERGNMVNAAAEVLPACSPHIQAALNDWIHANPQPVGASSRTNVRSLLNAALAAFATRSNEAYEPRPRPARLIPQGATY